VHTRSEGPWLFLALCVFWGGNWLATKGLVMNAPPFASAAARALLCGALMLALAGPAEARRLVARAPLAVVAIGLLTSTICNAAIYWGVTRLSTGLAAIVNNALTPIGLLVFGVLLGEESLSRRRMAGIALGVVGLTLLFARRTGGSFDGNAIAGLAAVAGGTLSYCLGSVWSRPLLRHSGPLAVGGMQMLVGGVFLVALSAAVERPGPDVFAAMGRPVFLASLAWTTLAGGAAALVIYLRLIRDWGPTRAGTYAFVTPIVATALGAIVLGERLGPLEIAGALVLLGAAALVLSGGFAPRSVGPPPTA
jgi:drug/metabolite transporter (DMT)-like permease